jgi:hypothetical protein
MYARDTPVPGYRIDLIQESVYATNRRVAHYANGYRP